MYLDADRNNKKKSLRHGIQSSLFHIACNVFQSALSGQIID